MSAPDTNQTRDPAIDALRGLCLLGIAIVNVTLTPDAHGPRESQLIANRAGRKPWFGHGSIYH